MEFATFNFENSFLPLLESISKHNVLEYVNLMHSTLGYSDSEANLKKTIQAIIKYC